MELNKISIGASGKNKPPKKEIDINVERIHIFYFFITLIVIVSIIYIALLNSGLFTKYEFSCVNGTIEEIVQGKEIYCGKHYSSLQYSLSPKKYELIERVILYGE